MDRITLAKSEAGPQRTCKIGGVDRSILAKSEAGPAVYLQSLRRGRIALPGAKFYKTTKISLGRRKRFDWFLTNEIKVEKPVSESLTQILNSHWSAKIELLV